jgi:hypothetical protein
MSRTYKDIYSQESIDIGFLKNIATDHGYKQNYQELSHTKPYHTKLAHKDMYSIPWWTKYIGEAFPTQANYTKCMQAIIQRCLYIMIHMQCKCKKCITERYTYATKQLPHTQLKKSNKHQTPPANEWNLLDLGVWWQYRLVGHVWVMGSKLSSLYLHCLSENDTSLLCAWFLNGALGSLQHLWHLCYHIEVEHGYTPHQSHSWCMWSKGAESNN